MNSEKGKLYFKIESGEVMKELRIAAGHKTQYAFEQAKGMTKGQYGRYERGENVRRETLVDILIYLNSDIGKYYTTVVAKVRLKLEDDLLKKQKADENE